MNLRIDIERKKVDKSRYFDKRRGKHVRCCTKRNKPECRKFK